MRNHTRITMMMIDIDDFKKINDTYGHDAGDQILKTVGNIMRMSVRDYDLVDRNVKEVGKPGQYAIRYGGEEFSLVLLDTDEKGAAVVGERLRKSIAAHVFQYQGHEIRLTVSIGIFSGNVYENNTDADALLTEINNKADEALYRAKALGKNRVVAYTSEKKNKNIDHRLVELGKAASQVSL